MSSTPLSVLVVDDDADACRNLEDILSDFGFSVETAGSGFEALEKIQTRAFDVALLDFRMPGMDGLALYRRIREEHGQTVAIVVTAHADDLMRERTMAAGAWKLFVKPVEFDELLNAINELAAQPLVLVVDDDRELCDSLWDVLRTEGYRVCKSHDAAEAARRMRQSNIDVAIVDVVLPVGSGEEVLAELNDTNPQARAIVITGIRKELASTAERSIFDRADAVCYKPFDVPYLLSTIRKLADRTSMRLAVRQRDDG